jgi:phosphatidylglycerol:prolipoprotein diacylglycerol transferase
MSLAYISWPVDMRREILGIPFFPHGILIAVGFVAGSWVMARYTRRRGLSNDILWDVLTWVAIGSLIGTRLAWVLGNWSELDSPAEAFMVWHGGMTLYGGILGGLVAGIWKVRQHGLPVLSMLDFAVPGLALGLVFGRASDLITGDHLGKPTGLPWGFRYIGRDAPGVDPPLGAVVHPVALYDLLSVTILFVVLVLFLRKARAPGSAAALFAIWYAAGRILLDSLRTDPTRAFGLTGTQLASVLAVPAVLMWLVLRERRGWRAERLEEWSRSSAGASAEGGRERAGV